QAARTRHVLHHDRGLAGNVPAQVGGEAARIKVIAASDLRRHDHPKRLAAVEVLSTGARRRRGERGHGQKQSTHRKVPPLAATLTSEADGTKRIWRHKSAAAAGGGGRAAGGGGGGGAGGALEGGGGGRAGR